MEICYQKSSKQVKKVAKNLLAEMTCGFPTELKVADVIPIFKMDDLLKEKNYTSVSLLQVVSKIFERLLHEQMFCINS